MMTVMAVVASRQHSSEAGCSFSSGAWVCGRHSLQWCTVPCLSLLSELQLIVCLEGLPILLCLAMPAVMCLQMLCRPLCQPLWTTHGGRVSCPSNTEALLHQAGTLRAPEASVTGHVAAAS